jgi:VanZ family protein
MHPAVRFAWTWLPAVLYAAAIFVVSSIHAPIRRPSFPMNDKLIHMVQYAGLAWLWFRAFSFGTRLDRKWIVILTLSITAVLGGLDEWYQVLNPTRSSDSLDFLADMLGGTIALTLVLFMRRDRVPT